MDSVLAIRKGLTAGEEGAAVVVEETAKANGRAAGDEVLKPVSE